MPTDDEVKSVLESVTKTKDQEIAELLEVNQQLDRDCTKLALRNAQLVIEIEQCKEQFDLVLSERNEAMDEKTSADRMRETVVDNLASMIASAGKAMRERDELARQLEGSRATVAVLNRKLAQLGMAWADDEDRHAVAALSEELDKVRAQRDAALLDAEALRPIASAQWNSYSLAGLYMAERDRARAERDEARRMYCEEAFCHRFDERRFNERCVPSPISNARQIAHNMKWDCFKENTND